MMNDALRTAAAPLERLWEIDFARAVAIVLVVMGHWAIGGGEPRWWTAAVDAIYTFHMPLFLAMSGYLYMRGSKPGRKYLPFLKGKAMRLLVPYFTVSVIVVTIKYLTQGAAIVQHPVTAATYFEVLYRPAAGRFLWFVWALWWMFVIMPAFRSRASRLILFVAAAVCAYVPFPDNDLLGLERTARMMVWFVAGTLLYDWRGFLPMRSRGMAFGAFALFAALLAAYLCGWQPAEYVIPYVAVYALPAMAYQWSARSGGRTRGVMLSLSSASFLVYLLHTTFEGFVKSFYLRYAPAGDECLYALAAIAGVAAGTAVPWWLYAKVLTRFRITRILFGLK
ncbi:MAG TPA: hypothetical protein DC009_02290 [Porphyromonadaceae bacterium]|nr:hypothetical protein [Porphyromonadaceae bacterium]